MTYKKKTSGTDKKISVPTSSSEKDLPTSSSNENKPQAKDKQNEINEATKANEKTKQPIKKTRSGVGFSVFAITLVIFSSAGLYYFTEQQRVKYDAQMESLISKIALLKSSQTVAEAQFQAEIKKNNQDMLVLIAQQDNTIKSLQSAFVKSQKDRPNDWLIAEADFLVNLAGRQLWLEHDVVTATTLMETADMRLAELNDPSLTPIRQAIAKDIQQLNAIKRIDTDGIVLRLHSLQQEIDKLPLANAILAKTQEETPKVVSSNVNDWKENLKTSLTDFVDQFITYRKRDGNVTPLLTPVQTFYLQENLKAKLGQAITAVYRENETLYDGALKTAQDWTERYFNQEEQITKSFIASLTYLEKQTIEASYPQVLLSQQMIDDLLADRLKRDLLPQVSEKTTEGILQ